MLEHTCNAGKWVVKMTCTHIHTDSQQKPRKYYRKLQCKHFDDLRIICHLCDKTLAQCCKSWSLCVDSPVLEGIVNNGFQYQSVTNVRRAAEMEHVNGPQGWMCIAQSTRIKHRENRITASQLCVSSKQSRCRKHGHNPPVRLLLAWRQIKYYM